MSSSEEGIEAQDELLINAQTSLHAINLVLSKEELHVISSDTSAPASRKAYSYLHVLDAQIQEAGDKLYLEIKILGKGKAEGIVTVRGEVQQESAHIAESWLKRLLEKAYRNVKRHRRLKVVINPVGGPGKTKSVWIKQIEPILRSAGCSLDVTYTTHSQHGIEIARDLDIDVYDSLVIFSGDGLVHEAINGLCQRKDAIRALRKCPIGVIPGGSGNGVSVSLNGPTDGTKASMAALTILKGRPMKIDLTSVTQGKERFYSFHSQAYGLMADVDLGTEHMRWMGTHRFTVGFVQRAIAGPKYDCEISMRVVKSDKHAMREEVLSRQPRASTATQASPTNPFFNSEDQDDDARDTRVEQGMPELKFGTVNDPITSGSGPDLEPVKASGATGWTTIDSPLCNFYAGQIPYLADNFLQFPIANNDGTVVVSILPVIRGITLLGIMDGSDSWKLYDNDHFEFYKVEAYRLTPKPSTNGLPNYISIDGEMKPYEPFQVEVHPGLGRMLSLYGHWYLPTA